MPKYLHKIFVGSILLTATITAFATDFVHPLDFKGTEVEKENVIAFIMSNVKETHSNIGLSIPTMLRKMERAEVNSFIALRRVEDRRLLDEVIGSYCKFGPCNYNTILMMYNERKAKSFSGRQDVNLRQNQS